MKATLHKMLSGYLLSLNGDIDDPYAIVNEQLADDYGWYKLSLKNCQAIERGYDLDELTHIRAEILNSYTSGTKWADDIDKLLTRYREVIELMGDKKFSEEDMKSFAQNYYREIRENKSNLLWSQLADKCLEEHIQSLQQTEWDVEIEMRRVKDETKIIGAVKGVKGSGNKITTYKSVPKLDENGCLILKKI